MSSEALKENQGAVRMNSTSEAACDIFALEQLTGRPSILRQSQADNISRTVLRGAKVCFQTPRRDPVTKKIMSPSRASRPSSQEDSSKALETLTASNDQTSLLNNPSTTPTDMQSNSVAYPDDDMLVQSRGAYTLDLDNLDLINPFQGSSTMQNSPPKSSALPESWTSELVEPDTTAAPISAPQPEVPEVTDTALDETLPFVPSVENSLAECSANISSAEGTVIIKTDNIENSATDVEESDMTEPAPVSQQIPVLEDQPEAQDSARPPVGSFNLDFDNLDLLNPFQTGGSKIPNSPLIGKASLVSNPPLPSQEAKQEPELSVHTPDVPTSSDFSIPPPENSTATEGSSSTAPPKKNQMLLEFNFDDGAEVKCKPPPKRLGVKRPAGAKPVTKKPVAPATEKKEPEPKQLSPKNPEETEPVDVPPPKGSYTFDFDKFDDPNFNPFGTKATMGNSPPRGVQTSPVLMKAPTPVQEPEAFAQDDQPEAPAQDDQPEHSSPPSVSETYENIAETDLPVTKRPAEDVESTSSDASIPPQESSTATEDSSSTAPLKENQMLLEFNFDDGAEVKRKPPPKRLGVKRPAGAKPVTKKPVAPATEKKEPEPKQLSPKNPEETEPVDVPPPKGSYTFDFDKFDDPNLNPFGTKATMGNSPPRGVQTSPVLMKAPTPVQEPEAFAQDDQPEHSSPPSVSETYENIVETDLPVTKRPAEDVESFTVSSTNIPQNPALQVPDLMATPKSKVDLLNQTCDLGMVAPSEDEFVPGALFMPGGDFDGQIDYLEQFGSSTFKESALRKQSLYLKFDPLLKESPKKTGMDSGNSGFSMPRPSLAIRMMEAAKSEVKQKSHSDRMKLLDDLPPPPVETVVPDPTVLDLLVPTLKQPVKTEDSIIEFLKYSQRDMDAALQKAERQAEERQQELTTQIEKLQLENQHMLFIVSEFEATITQITDEHKQKEDLAKIEFERVLQEKDQLSKDLNELERSFSSVVKRLDRCKEVIEGFKKNEETLKQYAQNCMDRLQKEEKRYQALKAHAEEKLDQANKAINEVRTKQGAEVATLQVQLKREQLKVQSLENDLEQKAKEVKDVTELCDELLLKVQKHGF
ncbi:transforming acidic coiled-coil-containing protein 3 isoform X1 [Sinocyclocheilus grahami]|uniref:transforming acidic coiled-coil-containing protein 3 isoform X1 n=1 Tax=Sinocyclocheilus grahami TaxID=75366 RepID=UPI0007AC5F7B|nr:PREDICTED: transforming acidic coiled-coil-containing protein 3-like isoform X1 [Sinocyclocheilus grahami]XP_016151067.1 PREDICTED: transforming acidic coiled-coil-containing protein 3-like isoform X1 [Sinocyclocheilus grahami]XP_016151068.1 PREDICTED: transforming acidic coiled-coil-containing protein 3-like isoform X1 [Sinocyclocheilus grahami]XP_016151069.1 PREDICTED: transforming acidic coiled-coil-containing protein 3-like isoform X1 [Sinocyclocheilus grahami]